MRKLSRAGQHTLEYTLLVVVVFIVVFFALQPNGLITKHIEQSIELSTQAVECMPYSVCYEPLGCPPQDNNGCCEEGEDQTNTDCGGAVCGDGTITPPEQCDDGNNIIGDGCDNCQSVFLTCGNGIVQPPEECDDGNLVAGDGCFQCQFEGTNYCYFEPWSPWSACAGSPLVQTRNRTCVCPIDADPHPIYGYNCDPAAPTVETQPCAVDGGWCPWEPFGYCSALCGGGLQGLQRKCDCPTPANGGANCVGNSTDTQPCNTGPCDGNMGMPGPGQAWNVSCDAQLYAEYQVDPYAGGCGPVCTVGQQYTFYVIADMMNNICEMRPRICANISCGGGGGGGGSGGGSGSSSN